MAELKKVKILFVEDENLLRSLFSELFAIDAEYQYEVLSAMDLKSGLEILATNTPNAIILDLILPYDKTLAKAREDLSEKMGFAFLKQIKTDSRYKDIPVIVFSNLNDTETQRKSHDAGAYAYLVKSATTPEHFTEVVKGALSGK